MSYVLHEIGHVVGFSEHLYATELSGPVWQTPSGDATITNTMVPDDTTSDDDFNQEDADGDGQIDANTDDTYWFFQGPSVNALMTSFDFNGAKSMAQHTAYKLPEYEPVTFDDVSLFGSVDLLNGVTGARRLLSNKDALILQDAYGYDINLPEQFATMYAVLNHETGVLTVRGGSDATVIDGVEQGVDSDVITINRALNHLLISVDVEHDVPGTGNGMSPDDQQGPFVTSFFADEVTEIQVFAGGGDDEITIIDNLGIPVDIDAGPGDDRLIAAFLTDDSDMEVEFTGGQGVDTLEVEFDADMTVSSGGFCIGTADGCIVHNVSFDDDDYPGVDVVELIGGTGANTFNTESFSGFVDLTGAGGNDTFIVGDADAALDGGNGNDSFLVGLGNNTYSGGIGYDTLSVTGTFDDDDYTLSLFGSALEEATISMLDGDDNVVVRGPAGILFSVFGGADDDTLDVSGSLSPAEVHGGFGDDHIIGSPQADMLFGEGNTDVIFGGDGGDQINGGDEVDVLFGEAGADLIEGGEANDLLVGGFDSDTLFGDKGNDLLIGGNDEIDDPKAADLSGDKLDGGPGEDVIAGDNAWPTLKGLDVSLELGGEDDILGGDGDDLIYGQHGNDRIQGNNGADTILAMAGFDLVFGGSIICQERGLDRFPDKGPPRGVPPRDTPGGDPNDHQKEKHREFVECFDDFHPPVRLKDRNPNAPPPPGTPPFLADGADEIDGGSQDDLLYGDNWSKVFQEFTLGGTGDFIEGQDGDDIVFGQVGEDDIQGDDGEDVMLGGGAADTIRGGKNDDWIAGQSGEDQLFGDEGEDEIDGGADADTLHGGEDGDLLYGRDGKDDLFGEEGEDILNGNEGADNLFGGSGVDLLQGHAGNDLLVGGSLGLTPETDNDILHGGDGDDMLFGDSIVSPLQIDEATGGNDTLNGDAGEDALFGQAGLDVLRGGSQDDQLSGGAGADQLSGDNGNDLMRGGSHDDRMFGGRGNDEMLGDDGDDEMVGGRGADDMQGGKGDDRMVGGNLLTPDASGDLMAGGAGSDIIRGDSGPLDDSPVNSAIGGNDVIFADGEDDTILGMAGDDTVSGGEGDDEIDGGRGDDFASGGKGADVINGGRGDDVLQGDDGNDLIRGGDNADFLLGNGGADILLGEGGEDKLDGGDGRDLLIGGRNSDSLSGGMDDDIVIGDTTSHDADDKALRAILAEWTSVNSYVNRIQNIMGVSNPTFASRLNGNIFLIPSGAGATVSNDSAADTLFGAADLDWFLSDALDTVSDAVASELVSNVF